MKRLLVVLITFLFVRTVGMVWAADEAAAPAAKAAAPAVDTAKAAAPAADAAAPAADTTKATAPAANAAAPAAAAPEKPKAKAVKKAKKPKKAAKKVVAAPTNAVIQHVAKPLAIDAGMEPFAGVPSIKLTGADKSKVVNGKVKNDEDLSADLRLAEDGKNLYLALDVVQGRGPVNKMNFENVWNADCLELYLSSKSGMVDVSRMKKSEWDYQLVLAPTCDKGKPIIRNFPSDTLKGTKVKVKENPKGYTMTALIPLANFKDCDWGPGKSYKFDAAIAKAGSAGARDVRIWWNSTLEAYDNPSQWGVAEIK